MFRSRSAPADATTREIDALIQLQLSPGRDITSYNMKKLGRFTERHSETILQCLKKPMKYSELSIQLTIFTIIDTLLEKSHRHFGIALSTGEWPERFFRLAKDTPHEELRDTVIRSGFPF